MAGDSPGPLARADPNAITAAATMSLFLTTSSLKGRTVEHFRVRVDSAHVKKMRSLEEEGRFRQIETVPANSAEVRAPGAPGAAWLVRPGKKALPIRGAEVVRGSRARAAA